VGICRSISLAGLATLVLCLIACGPSFNFKGRWSGNRNLAPVTGENPGITRTLGQVTLVIDSVGFELTEAGINTRGTVRYADGKAYLKIEERLGTPIDREPKEVQDQLKTEIVLTPRPDGNLDFQDPAGLFKESVTLTRSTDAKRT